MFLVVHRFSQLFVDFRSFSYVFQIIFCTEIMLLLNIVQIFVFTEVLSKIALNEKISFISLSLSPLMFPSSIIKKLQARVFEIGLTPIIPLCGIDSEIFDNAKEIGLEKYIGKIEKFLKTKITQKQEEKISKKKIDNIVTNKKAIIVKFSPNMVHDILDSVESKH